MLKVKVKLYTQIKKCVRDGTVVVIEQQKNWLNKILRIFLFNKECKMKKVNIFALWGLLFGIMACSSEGEKHADVTLSTVQCGMCKKTIESGMAKVDGISKFDVDLNTKVGHVLTRHRLLS